MRILNEQEKRDSLQQLLTDLSKSQDVLKDSKTRSEYFLRLESIYYNTGSANFRHYYSDIFACLTLIDGDPSLGNLDVLAQNMNTLKEGYKSVNRDDDGNTIDIGKEIIKLYDHINLDISRINYSKRMANESSSELAKARLLISELDQKIKDSETARTEAIEHLNNESIKLKEEVRTGQKNMQNEYITILGIFAAIVLAFTGGLTFSTSVLENIEKATPYRILAIVLILGLILFNLIWLLIDFLRDINGKSIRKWWILFITDTIIIIGLIVTFLAFRGRWFDNGFPASQQAPSESSEIDNSIPQNTTGGENQ